MHCPLRYDGGAPRSVVVQELSHRRLVVFILDATWALGRKMISLSIWFMSLVALAGVLLAPWIFRLLTPGLDEPAKVLGTWLAQIMYPFIAPTAPTWMPSV